jgi:hypothetical protein
MLRLQKNVALVSALLFSSFSIAQSQATKRTPNDGNDLLEQCQAIVSMLDAPDAAAQNKEPEFTGSLMKLSWCSGYLEAFRSLTIQAEISLGLAGAVGVKMVGPDKARHWAFDKFRIACLPDKAPTAELARVLVKWLRDHPERLHELKMSLTIDAFNAAFPCPAIPDDDPEPAPKKK